MDINNYIDEAFHKTIEKSKNNIEETLNELKEAINEKLNEYGLENKPVDSQRNTISLLDKTRNENNVTSKCRDNMYLARRQIIEDYYQKTLDKGNMYYIYNICSDKENTFLMSIPLEEKSHEIFEIKGTELPEGAGVDSVLRLKNNHYELDKEATKTVLKEMEKKFDELLKEQEKWLQSKRIEGHIYQAVEVQDKGIWLTDIDNPRGTFQEMNFSKEILNLAQNGDYFQYINGKYEYIK